MGSPASSSPAAATADSAASTPSPNASPPPSSSTKKRKDGPAVSAMFHPTSEWLEPDREDGLTLYEIHRPPRVAAASAAPGTRIRRSLQDINNEFKCGICLHYIANARIVRNCLHRFCHECVETALRKRCKHCPICRAPMGSRRCLAPDPGFDRLVRVIVGDPASSLLRKLDRDDDEGYSQNAEQLQLAIQRKRQFLRQQQQQTSPQPLPSESGRTAAASPALAGLEPTIADVASAAYQEDWIRVELRRHVKETQLDDLRLPYVRLQKAMPLRVLQSFLWHKLDLFPKHPGAERQAGTASEGAADPMTAAPQGDGAAESSSHAAEESTPVALQMFVQTPQYAIEPLKYHSGEPSSSSLVLVGALHKRCHQQGRLRLFYRRAPTPAPAPPCGEETSAENERSAIPQPTSSRVTRSSP